MQLPPAHVDGVHPQCAALEERVGESAGGGAQVDADAPLDRQAELVQRLLQLEASARDVSQRFLDPQLQRRVEQLAGLLHPMIAGDDAPGEDQRLRLGARLGEPALLQQHVGAHLHLRCSGGAGVAGPISWAIRASRRSMSMGLLK